MTKLTERLLGAENGGASHEDLVGAAGLASVNQPLGSALQRALGSLRHADESHIVELLEGERHVRESRLPVATRRILLRAAVRVWLVPVCNTCHGLGFKVIPDTTTLSDVPCPSCLGSGRQRMDLPGPEGELLRWAGAEMDRTFEMFERRLARKLGRDQ